jgi:hypothetical protein
MSSRVPLVFSLFLDQGTVLFGQNWIHYFILLNAYNNQKTDITENQYLLNELLKTHIIDD